MQFFAGTAPECVASPPPALTERRIPRTPSAYEQRPEIQQRKVAVDLELCLCPHLSHPDAQKHFTRGTTITFPGIRSQHLTSLTLDPPRNHSSPAQCTVHQSSYGPRDVILPPCVFLSTTSWSTDPQSRSLSINVRNGFGSFCRAT